MHQNAFLIEEFRGKLHAKRGMMLHHCLSPHPTFLPYFSISSKFEGEEKEHSRHINALPKRKDFFLIVNVGFYFHSSVFTHFVTISHIVWPPLLLNATSNCDSVFLIYLVISLLCLYFASPNVNTDVLMQ